MPPKAAPWEGRFSKKIYIGRYAHTCWLWCGKIDIGGYGMFSVGRKWVRAHRFIYEKSYGLIPAGLQIDHLCRVRSCVNPAHLEAVTQRENLLRGETLPASEVKRTHCPHGHEYDVENTYLHRGSRHCLTCMRSRTSIRNKNRKSSTGKSLW